MVCIDVRENLNYIQGPTMETIEISAHRAEDFFKIEELKTSVIQTLVTKIICANIANQAVREEVTLYLVNIIDFFRRGSNDTTIRVAVYPHDYLNNEMIEFCVRETSDTTPSPLETTILFFRYQKKMYTKVIGSREKDIPTTTIRGEWEAGFCKAYTISKLGKQAEDACMEAMEAVVSTGQPPEHTPLMLTDHTPYTLLPQASFRPVLYGIDESEYFLPPLKLSAKHISLPPSTKEVAPEESVAVEEAKEQLDKGVEELGLFLFSKNLGIVSKSKKTKKRGKLNGSRRANRSKWNNGSY